MAAAILSKGRCRVRPVTVLELCSGSDRAFCLLKYYCVHLEECEEVFYVKYNYNQP